VFGFKVFCVYLVWEQKPTRSALALSPTLTETRKLLLCTRICNTNVRGTFLSFDELLLVTAGGLIVGFIGGYAGIGAAPVLVFVYGYFLGYSQHMAQGTVAAIMLGPLSLPSVIVMWSHVRKHLTSITIGVLTYAVFSYPGAVLAYGLPPETLRLIFAGFLLLLGARSLLMVAVNNLPSHQKVDPSRKYLSLNVPSMTVLGAIIGMIGGFFSIGAGILLVPVLIWLFGVDKNDARAIR
jgi:uncharacterized membrane protein YfcA